VTANKEALIDAAVSKATELGCDVLVHQALYEMQAGQRAPRRLTGVAAWLFACGVFDAAKQAEEIAELASTALQIAQSENGGVFCTTQAPTGSHVPRTICRLPGAYRVWANGATWVRWDSKVGSSD
jgi:hypothetical protein